MKQQQAQTRQQAVRPTPILRTKRYQLPTNVFIKVGMVSALKQYWWAGLVALALLLPIAIWPSTWVWVLPSVVGVCILYLLFWYIQFYGITQLPQGKMLFEKYIYEVHNQFLLMMKNDKEGMPIKWEQIKRAEKRDDAYLLWLSVGQFCYLPFTIFNSNTDMKLLEKLLVRKGLMADETAAKVAA